MTVQYYIDHWWSTVNCTLSSIVKSACYISEIGGYQILIPFELVTYIHDHTLGNKHAMLVLQTLAIISEISRILF